MAVMLGHMAVMLGHPVKLPKNFLQNCAKSREKNLATSGVSLI